MTIELLPCPVDGCERRRSANYMMCRSDWSRVSKRTRDEVYRRFASYRAATGLKVNEFRAARDAYYDIHATAIGEAEASRRRSANR